MKPKKKQSKSESGEYTSIGIPVEWVDPLKVLGYTTVEMIKAFEKPGKLYQEMRGYRKKNKLRIQSVTVENFAA